QAYSLTVSAPTCIHGNGFEPPVEYSARTTRPTYFHNGTTSTLPFVGPRERSTRTVSGGCSSSDQWLGPDVHMLSSWTSGGFKGSEPLANAGIVPNVKMAMSVVTRTHAVRRGWGMPRTLCTSVASVDAPMG